MAAHPGRAAHGDLPTAARAPGRNPETRGGKRMLGIPTVMDRLIQQALLQVLTPIFDPQFSEASYGFRPGRRAHEAVKKARQYVEEGYEWAVDMDLEKFFDRVNHDILMVPGSPEGHGQTSAQGHSPIPPGRDHGEWGGHGKRGRDTTGRAAESPVGEYPSGRPGQRTGKERSQVRPVCG
ncbi:protein of unknown function [Kyrpidia spormannii]|uniref:Uncharacterized protein n=1 Tax=Kyrpidia spormannii TaxID=2055160 RepID=A0ACA8Z5D1_9BACL|nr:protein of unknown function [Kyrpidia spormannii]